MKPNFNWMTLEQAVKELSLNDNVWFLRKDGSVGSFSEPLREFIQQVEILEINGCEMWQSGWQTQVCRALKPLAPSKIEEESECAKTCIEESIAQTAEDAGSI